MLPRAPPAKKKPCIKTSQQAAARKGGFFHGRGFDPGETEEYMQFFASAITTLQTLVIALGAGLGVCGAWSICWRAMARTTPALMLMVGKEATINQI